MICDDILQVFLFFSLVALCSIDNLVIFCMTPVIKFQDLTRNHQTHTINELKFHRHKRKIKGHNKINTTVRYGQKIKRTLADKCTLKKHILCNRTHYLIYCLIKI